MSVIVRGMDMPKSCRNCLFECYYENLGGHTCDCLEKTVDDNERWDKRLDGCPLVEIVTCKDCKHNKNGICPNYRHFVDDNFYCADGERKEEWQSM